MKEQCKIFKITSGDEKEAEEKISRFLSGPTISVVRVVQSSAQTDVFHFASHVTIFYTKKVE